MLAHVNGGVNPKTGGCNTEEKALACPTCDGVGTISAEHAQRIVDGKRLRAERVERGETLLDAATRMGLKASELSAIESGRRLAVH
jgi:ribosomal protein S27AE